MASVNGGTYNYDHADNLIKLADGTTRTFDAAGELTRSTPPPPPPAPRFATDQVVVTDQAVAGRAITSRSLATRAPGELVVVLVSANGPSTKAQSITKVTGAGLTFRLASRATATGYGTAEVWQAYATNKITGPITAALAWPGYDGSITVETFTGAAPTVTVTRSARTFSAKPAVALTPTTTGSLILAAGHDWSHAAKATPAIGQALIHLWQNTRSHNSYWIQRVTLDVKGRAVTVADALPTADRWELAAAEVSPAKPAPAVGPTTYSYNPEGDRVSITPSGAAATRLHYDQGDHLIGYGSTAVYTYDGDGLRASKTVSGITTSFTWDTSGSLPLVLQDGSSTYVYGPDGTPLERITGSTATYLFHDQQGSTRLLTSSAGALTGTYSYDAYGRTTAHTGASANLQYDSQYTDAESGYQYLRARYYDPLTLEFISTDIASEWTQQRYQFAAEDPLNTADPLGLFPGQGLLRKVGNVAATGLRLGIDVAAVIPYSVYYFTYNAGELLQDAGSHFGPIGTAIAGTVALPLVPLEAAGLGGDTGIDVLKGWLFGHESIYDEGVICYINPLHSVLPPSLRGPKAYLPGLYKDPSGAVKVDFVW